MAHVNWPHCLLSIGERNTPYFIPSVTLSPNARKFCVLPQHLSHNGRKFCVRGGSGSWNAYCFRVTYPNLTRGLQIGSSQIGSSGVANLWATGKVRMWKFSGGTEPNWSLPARESRSICCCWVSICCSQVINMVCQCRILLDERRTLTSIAMR